MGRILAVGDIHTKAWIFDLVEQVVDNYDTVVFCGDYADNWNTLPTESLATWRRLKKFIKDHPHARAVCGNHDYAYLHPSIAGHSSGWNAVTYALINSPENRKLKEFLYTLPITIEIDGVTFSHAGITDRWDGLLSVESIWNDVSPIWARPPAWGGQARYKQIKQVIGHNPSESIWNPQKDIWCIDTFSETSKNKPIGDHSVLEIIDGETFKKIQINAHHNNPTSFEGGVS